MFKSYRFIILAAFGWMILAASPEQKSTGSNESQAEQANTQALRDIATALKAANERQNPDAGCRADQDDRSSDLCAQWKAADAAKNSADWTRRTFWLALIGTVIGGLTLLAAGFAAKFAKDAATHTETGAIEARRAASAAEDGLAETRRGMALQLRPYVNFTDDGEGNQPVKFERGERIPFAIQNFGQTPAKNVGIKFAYDITPRPIGNITVEHLSLPEFFGMLAPGQFVKDHLVIDFSTGEIAKIAAGETLVLRMILIYGWDGGHDQCDVTWVLSATGNNPWRFARISNEERKRT